jgi:hypothetical protein
LSEGLIQDAEYAGKDAGPEQTLQFFVADVTQDEWAAQLPPFEWSGIFCFAVLHHIPGNGQRRALCAQMRGLLTENSLVYISVWQPLNSPRLKRRIQPWNAVGIEDGAVDAGDILMEWRAHISGLEEAPALRYVHVFSEEELSYLAVDSGFKVTETFYSDGKEGNLALYQKWRPVF